MWSSEKQDILPLVEGRREAESSWDSTEDGVAQRDDEELVGCRLRLRVSSLRPLGASRVRSFSYSSAASFSTFLYLQYVSFGYFLDEGWRAFTERDTQKRVEKRIEQVSRYLMGNFPCAILSSSHNKHTAVTLISAKF